MQQLVFHSFPGACSLVSHIALEMAGAPFKFVTVDLSKGQQRSAEFLAVNPRGKVPALVVGTEVVTENLAILLWIHRNFPQSRVLPGFESAQGVQALSAMGWFASGVHPFLTRTFAPGRFVEGVKCQTNLRELATRGLHQELALLDARLAGREWWLDELSGVDGYLFWLWARACDSALDRASYPNLCAHSRRMLDLPAVQRALARERSVAPCFVHL